VQRLPGLVQEHGPVKWLLLTLTIRNVPVESLKEGCRTLLDGFRRLTNSKTRLGRLWPATGWIRALEVTFPREGEAHPHLHVLAAVRPSYFKGGNYVSQAEWVRRWREAARLDYDPVVDVRRVKPLNLPENALPAELSEALGGLREVSKYIVKPADWTPTAVAALTSVGRIRFIEGGGWLKGVFREDDADQLEDVPDDPVEVATFWWRAAEWRYRRKL
jgi:plasmid rolling circle replication initiator protein Rep